MARIAGIDLPREKRVEIGLTYIYGIGRVSSNKILEAANVNPDTRVRELTDDEVKRIAEVIEKDYMVEGDLRREIALNIKRLQEIGCYRGIRHRKGLPVRGQKTKTNARTRKGPRKTVAGKKKQNRALNENECIARSLNLVRVLFGGTWRGIFEPSEPNFLPYIDENECVASGIPKRHSQT